MGRKKKNLMEIQESLLRLAAKETDDGFEALKALVWASVDMAEIALEQIKSRLGTDKPFVMFMGKLTPSREIESVTPEHFLRTVVELGIEIRRKYQEEEGSKEA